MVHCYDVMCDGHALSGTAPFGIGLPKPFEEVSKERLTDASAVIFTLHSTMSCDWRTEIMTPPFAAGELDGVRDQVLAGSDGRLRGHGASPPSHHPG